MLFRSGKTYFLIFLEKKEFLETSFCLFYIFPLQFCCSKLFSLLGKTIDISYHLARKLGDNTI